MGLIGLLVKVYAAVLLFRTIMTRQELNFNFIGRVVAKVTDPIFNVKLEKTPKAGWLAVFYILILGLLYGILTGIFTGSSLFTGIIIGYRDLLIFLAQFFVVCILLGSIASRDTGAFSIFFYRLGNLWVKPIRKIVRVKSNWIVVPAILLVMVAYVAVDFVFTSLLVAIQSMPFSVWTVLKDNFLSFAYGMVQILTFYIVILVIRALMSWFSPDPRNVLVQLIYQITEPVLAPMRWLIPPIGIIDVSAILTIIGLGVVQQLLYAILNLLR